CSELGGGRSVVSNRLLIDVVVQEKRVDQSSMISCVKNAISGPQESLTITRKNIRKPGARGNVVFGRVNHAGLGVVWIYDGRLGNCGIVVTQAKTQQKPGVESVLVLPIEAIRHQVGVDRWVAETLGIGGPVLGSRSVPTEV